jgi:hypothetical protein
MAKQQFLNIDDQAASIQTHLSIIQNVIQRMAENSSASKTWCVTLVSAVLVIVADKGKPDYAWIALLPTLVFAALDSYYLALEKGFRNAYNEFIEKLHKGILTPSDLYSVAPMGRVSKLQLEAMRSPSVWGFYVPMVVLIAITKEIAIG